MGSVAGEKHPRRLKTLGHALMNAVKRNASCVFVRKSWKNF